MTTPSRLPGFAAFLKRHHQAELCQEFLRWVDRLDVPMFRLFRQLPADDFDRMLHEAMGEFLADLETGGTLQRARETIRRIEADAYPGLPRDSVQPGDLVRIYAARKGALLTYVERYPVDKVEALALVRELEALFLDVQDLAIHSFTDIREQTVKRMTEYELRQRTMEDSLHLTETRLHLLVQNVQEYAIYWLDPEGRVLTWNDGAQRNKGYTSEEILGRSFECFYLPEDRAAGVPFDLLARARAEGSVRVEGWRVRKDGATFWAEVVLSAIHDVTGELVGFATITRDLSERKHMDTLKDQFLSILSHELRTPINAITGFGSILADELAGPLDERQHAYLRKMIAGADQLLALVDDLLDMSRIQAGEFQLVLQPVAFPEVLHGVLETLTPLAVRKGHRLLAEWPEDCPPTMADPQRVGQVIINLVTNALKFTPEGGQIEVRATCEADRIRCEVEDDGPGIVPEDLPKLFQRFTQLDMSATRKVGGVGLGLSICKELVEAHGGQIGVTCEPGRGCTFWFELPVVPVSAAAPTT